LTDPRSRRLVLKGAASVAVIVIAGCAPEIPRRPTSFTPVSRTQTPTVLRLREPATVYYGTMFPRQLAAGSQWIEVGEVPEGQVYRPLEGVFTVEGAHVHEAGLVLRRRTLVGLYLFVEREYVAVTSQVILNVDEGK
jgi:hypothetical protein